MAELYRRYNIIFIILLISVSLLVFFGVFLPLKNELNDLITQSFVYEYNNKYVAFESIVDKCVDLSKSVANNESTKEGVLRHRNGEINFIELQDYYEKRYHASARDLDNIVGATRYIEGEKLIQYINYSIYEENWNFSFEADDEVQVIYNKDINHLCKVVIPSTHVGKVISYDVLIFDLSDEYSFYNEGYAATLVSDDELELSLGQKTKSVTRDGSRVYTTSKTISSTKKLDEDTYFVVDAQRDVVYGSFNVIIKRITIISLGIILLIVLVMYFTLFRYANKKVGVIEKSRDEFKGLAYKDKLTCAYSRRFLDIWKENIRSEFDFHTLIVFDIDDLKYINDTYGHLVGDEVIKSIATALESMIRQNDFLIRYGGDEFIMLLANASEESTNSTMDRIIDRIDSISGFDFKIGASYGVAYLQSGDDFDEKFKLADERMYERKKQKRMARKLNSLDID